MGVAVKWQDFFPRRTVRRLRPEELTVTNVSELNKRTSFDSEIRDIIGDLISLPENAGKDSMERNDLNADSKDEDAFEKVSPMLMPLTLLSIEPASNL